MEENTGNSGERIWVYVSLETTHLTTQGSYGASQKVTTTPQGGHCLYTKIPSQTPHFLAMFPIFHLSVPQVPHEENWEL